jgi:hypothetical protein
LILIMMKRKSLDDLMMMMGKVIVEIVHLRKE